MSANSWMIACACALVVGTAAADARADEGSTTDGYCDYVKAVASAERSQLLAPEVFSSFGYVDQLGVAVTPGAGRDDLRLTVGFGYSLNGLYRARLQGKRAEADCRRYRALSAMNRDSTYLALEARARVLAASIGEAEKRLERVARDFSRRRTTRQELIATRLRVDQLRRKESEARRQLDAMPAPASGDVAGALGSYYAADADLEGYDASLRRAGAWDLSVRMGYDKFLENDDSSPYFAVVSARFNLGWLLQGRANARAAEARRRFARADGGVGGFEAHRARLEQLLETERKRAEENQLLVKDLELQLEALRSVGGDAGERLRSTMWFEWVEVRAEQAYLRAHIDSLEAMLGAAP